MNPETLAIIAGVLVAWIVSHALGLGEIIDVIIAVTGMIAIGFSVFTGLDHLYDFAVGAYRAKSEHDLENAADDLAKAISILGIQTVLAILFRGARMPRTHAEGRVRLGQPPPKTPGIRYRPTVRQDPARPAGDGYTTFWGDIVVSSRGSANDRAVVLLHEKVHRFLMPKLYLLRNYRASNRAASYKRSSRYSAQFKGSGLFPEGAALLYMGIVSGIAFEIRSQPGVPSGFVPATANATP